MNFCVDIGNSNTVIGLIADGTILQRWRIETNRNATFDDIKARIWGLLQICGIPRERVKTVIISSVVPLWNHSWERFSRDFFGSEALFVGPGIKTGIRLAVDNPREVGADRIVNAAAAIEQYPQGALVVDSGTAITIDIVTPDKSYIGGAIMPGIMISLEALAARTAKLSRISIEKPPQAIGRNTADGIRTGMLYGFAGMIDRVIEESLKELDFKPAIIATGGLAGDLSEVSKYIERYDRDLTLRGLDLIARRNS